MPLLARVQQLDSVRHNRPHVHVSSQQLAQFRIRHVRRLLDQLVERLQISGSLPQPLVYHLSPGSQLVHELAEALLQCCELRLQTSLFLELQKSFLTLQLPLYQRTLVQLDRLQLYLQVEPRTPQLRDLHVIELSTNLLRLVPQLLRHRDQPFLLLHAVFCDLLQFLFICRDSR